MRGRKNTKITHNDDDDTTTTMEWMPLFTITDTFHSAALSFADDATAPSHLEIRSLRGSGAWTVIGRSSRAAATGADYRQEQSTDGHALSSSSSSSQGTCVTSAMNVKNVANICPPTDICPHIQPSGQVDNAYDCGLRGPGPDLQNILRQSYDYLTIMP